VSIAFVKNRNYNIIILCSAACKRYSAQITSRILPSRKEGRSIEAMGFRLIRAAIHVVDDYMCRIESERFWLLIATVLVVTPLVGQVVNFNKGLDAGLGIGTSYGVYSAENVASQCPVLSTPTANKIVGGGWPLTVMSDSGNCVFMQGSVGVITITMTPDPHGTWFAKKVLADSGAKFHLNSTVIAAWLGKETGVYFDYRGNLVTVATYNFQNLALPVADAVASAS